MSLWKKITNTVEHLDPATAAISGNSPSSALFGPAQNWFSHKPTPDTSASDMLANLYSNEWQDYLTRFAPEENVQLGLMTDASNSQERQKAVGAVSSAYARAPADYQRQAMGYGMTITPQQQQSFAQRSDTQQGLDKTTAYNRTAQNQQDRAYGVLPSFVSPNVGGQGGISPASGTLGGYH